ncbi:MAG: nitroreductase/quinone reductase family protein [Candidatus Limnocylindrales bacterium]|jgi:hypothetical protein
MTNATGIPGGKPSASDLGRRAPALYRFVNPLMRRLLQSPIHRLLSGQLMLLEYTGRVSGRSYAIPIGYFAWDGGSVLSVSGSRWWKNLRDGRPVSLLVRGVRHAAVPTVIESADSRAELFAEFVRRFGPKAAGRLQAGLPSDRDPTPDELRSAAAKKMLVRFDPAGGVPIA